MLNMEGHMKITGYEFNDEEDAAVFSSFTFFIYGSSYWDSESEKYL